MMATGDITTQLLVGLEIHVQLRTQTKMFCGCRLEFEAPPNSLVCPVCLGHPGTLPVINREAVRLSILTGMALNCQVARFTKWDRKSYYYPDMPKNYQISQYDLPLSQRGHLEFQVNGETKSVRIRRAHLEEDAGKNIHDTPGCTLVDLNRAGTPLLEIVTEPDIFSAEEAYAFCTELQRLITYLGVSEGNMKKGQMRFEPNVNVVIQSGRKEFRTPIVEVKNLNSFKSVRSAIAYEQERHIAAWRADSDYVIGKAPNENRGWDDERGVTEFQRGKEGAHDYRYFPDPDLVPMVISDAMLADWRGQLPELPAARLQRLVAALGVAQKDAETILADRAAADHFEAALASGAPADLVSKQFINTWLKLASDKNVSVKKLGVDPARMAELAKITGDGTINRSAVTPLAEAMLTRSESPRVLAAEMGLIQVQDTNATAAWVEQAFAENAQAVQDALANPKKAKAAAGFLRGQVMKISGGKADPRLVGELIEKRLATL